MENAYHDRLPADIRNLVREIEEKAEIEIEIEIDPSRARGVPDEPDRLACEVDEDGARLLLPSPDYFPESSVLHELLHIRRFLVERVPKLVVCEDKWNPEFEQGLLALDNNLEHLLIVPEELRLRPDRSAWWESRIRRALELLSKDQVANRIDRDNQAFVAWVFIRHVLGNENLLELARQILGPIGLVDRAEQLLHEVSRDLKSKETLAHTWIKNIGLPADAICFQYIDPRSHSVEETPLIKTSCP